MIAVQSEAGGATTILPAPPSVAMRLRRMNWVAAVAFTLGGSLFAIGAWVAQVGSGDATTAASLYFRAARRRARRHADRRPLALVVL